MVLHLPDSWLNWNLEMLVFEERGKPEYPEKNLLEQGREPATNSTHIWHQTWEMNLGHIGVSGVLSPLHHHCSTFLYWPTLKFSSLFRNFRQRIYLNSFSSKQYAIREKEIEKEFSSLYAKIWPLTQLAHSTVSLQNVDAQPVQAIKSSFRLPIHMARN